MPDDRAMRHRSARVRKGTAAHSANAQAVKKATGTDSTNITMIVRLETLSGWRAVSGHARASPGGTTPGGAPHRTARCSAVRTR